MSIKPGHYVLGPENGTLLVTTTRTGAASKAGHDLTIEVSAWEAALELAGNPEASRAVLRADARSLRVLEGRGGIQKLGDEDKAGIRQSIDEDVLKGTAIEFRSRMVELSPGGDRLIVQGELELMGKSAPLTFELTASEDGRVTGSATVKQTTWGIKPFSILFGTIKVADEVGVAIDAALTTGPPREIDESRG